MPKLEAGAAFGPFRLVRPLGRGGFAEVWEAESLATGRQVALKILTELRAESERGLERFRQEGRLAASLANPRCVYVFDAGAVEGFPYIAMELMTGGTLAERIADGPLGARAAVDVVLDVLEGLESAQQAGILHRDVKPSNVFLDAQGRAKIGDFGISKSLEVDSHLSQTGAFLGTPFYASPEQIAAEPLDLRSDLYSVGAMLYELVTGKLPYAGTNASQVLAQVLTREPVPFAQHAVAVPAALQHVILRLLAKPKERRFQSYEQLRAALVPLSSHGLAPAGLARRFGAFVLDILLFLPIGLALTTASFSQVFQGRVALAGMLMPLLQLVYFTLTERFWRPGASVGKRLLGLRVTTVDGVTPSLGRVALRASVFLSLYAGPGLLLQAFSSSAGLVGRPVLQYLPVLLQLAMIGVLVSTMRRRNGSAGLHEVASGTRVMAVLARDAGEGATAVPRVALAATAVADATAFGPYRATGTVWRRGTEALLVARDADLHRDVWIHELRDAATAPPPPIERLRVRGEGSLPWLQRGGGTTDGVTWDAYGAPQGTAFARWAAERRGLGWREMRDILGSLVAELASRFARDGTAGPLSPGRVWIDPSGRALLLDFPADAPRGGEGDDAAVEVTPATWRAFVARIVALGFAVEHVPPPPAVPLPEYARALIAGLSAEQPVADFQVALARVATRPAAVSRARRAGPFAVLALVPAFVLLAHLVVPLMMARMPPWYREIAVNGDAYRAVLRRADSAAARAPGPGADTTRRTVEAIQVVLAAALRDARQVPQASGPLLGAMPAAYRAMLDSAAARYPAPDSQQVAAARGWLAARVTVPQLRGGVAAVPKSLAQSGLVLGYLGVAGALLALLLRGGVLLGLFGIGVVRSDGAPAGRVRCLARALVAWSPLLLLVALAAAPATPPLAWLRWTLIALALSGAAVAVWRPARGLAERASGVVLVPK